MMRYWRLAGRSGVVALLGGAILGGCSYQFTEVEGRGGWRAERERVCMATRKPSATIAEIEPIIEGSCGMDFPLEVTALSSGTVVVGPMAKMGCPLADALETWLATVVQPAARAEFGSPVVEITQISAYACRNRNNFGKELSEHAFGNALDISGFKLANGKVITVQHGWKSDGKEQAFLKTIFAGGCRYFTTSLGPGSNIMHYNHFHVDLAKLAPDGSPKMCKAGGVTPPAGAGEGVADASDTPDGTAPLPVGGTAVPGAD